MTIPLLLAGCYQLDGFFFNPEAVDAYTLGGEVIPLSCQQLVTFDGEAGSLYGAWAHQPETLGEDCEAGVAKPDAPVVIFFHGNADNIDTYWQYSEMLWELGFESLQFDYRGYGRSDGDPSFDGVIADGATAIAYAAETAGRPSTEIAFIGLSLGGFVAVHNLEDTPPGVLITMDMFANTQKMLDDGTTLDLPAGWFFAENFDNLGPLRKMSPDIPLLVLHGDADDYIQPEHAELIFDAAAATEKELVLVEGADHADSLEVDPELLNEKIGGWIDSHLSTE